MYTKILDAHTSVACTQTYRHPIYIYTCYVHKHTYTSQSYILVIYTNVQILHAHTSVACTQTYRHSTYIYTCYLHKHTSTPWTYIRGIYTKIHTLHIHIYLICTQTYIHSTYIQPISPAPRKFSVHGTWQRERNSYTKQPGKMKCHREIGKALNWT